jgi:ABC-type nitrate/sulfonate/bicarbonate transport system substrate-binding protein
MGQLSDGEATSVTRPGRWLLAGLSIGALVGCRAVAASTPVPPSGHSAAGVATQLATPTAEPGSHPLRLAYVDRDAGNAAVWIAQAAGLFRKNELTPTVVELSDRAALDALATGTVDVLVGPGSAALAASAAGRDVRVVAGLVNAPTARLLVHSSIELPNDLRGTRLAVGRPGSVSDIAARYALRELRLEPGKEVGLLQIGSASERQAALENGAVQAVAVPPPESVALERIGLTSLFDLWGTGGELAISQVLVPAALAQEQPGLVQRVVDSLVEAIALAKRDRAFAKRVLAEHVTPADDLALEDTYELFLVQLGPRVPYPTTEGLRRLVPLLAATDPRAARIETEALVDRAFVQRAVDRGLIAQLYGRN